MRFFPSGLGTLVSFAMMAAALTVQPAQAQPFPSRPVRVIAPLGPGTSDNIIRLVARLAAVELGQPTFVDNKPGGDTLVAVQSLLSSPADGYSVLYVSPGSMVINPLVMENLPYDPQRDIRPLAGAMRSYSVLVTGAGSRFKSFVDVVAALRKTPKSVSMASYSAHYRLGALAMQQDAGVEFNHIPYKSAGQVQTDLMGGNVDVALIDVSGALPLVASGKLKALAVATRDRQPRFANVPTFRESGLPNFDHYVWTGFGISAKTPEPVARVLEAALLKAMRQPEYINYITQTVAAEVFTVSGKEFSTLIAAETVHYRQFAKQLDALQR